MNRAYSTFEIKAATDTGGKRTFTGIASTVETDRVGDIVEPEGAQIKLPLPLLWQHDSKQPIGWVHAARVNSKRIEVDCEIADVAEPASLKDRLDTAWSSIRSKLVRGLSIGFRPIETNRIDGTSSYRFVSFEIFELSAVTIPANASASITAIKSADQAIRRAASGARPVVRLDPAPAATGNTTLPGASGTTAQTRRKGVVYLN